MSPSTALRAFMYQWSSPIRRSQKCMMNSWSARRKTLLTPRRLHSATKGATCSGRVSARQPLFTTMASPQLTMMLLVMWLKSTCRRSSGGSTVTRGRPTAPFIHETYSLWSLGSCQVYRPNHRSGPPCLRGP